MSTCKRRSLIRVGDRIISVGHSWNTMLSLALLILFQRLLIFPVNSYVFVKINYLVRSLCFILGSGILLSITKTCLYNFDPLKSHFYIVKLGFTGVYIIFLISSKNIDCGHSLEPPRRGGSNEYHNLCFEQKYEKNIRIFHLKNFIFWWLNFQYI